MTSPFHQRVVALIRSVPPGRVCTYGLVARMAGEPRGARQVSRFIHSSTVKYGLPWWRIINAQGGISIPPGPGYDRQKRMLEDEGVVFDKRDRIDFERFLWSGEIL